MLKLNHLKQTENERLGTIDGINLFFGALLGANLGTIERLAIDDYVKLVALLAGTVMTLRMVSTSHRKLYAVATLAGYAALVAGVFLLPNGNLIGLEGDDKARLAMTLVVWTVFVLFIEFWPAQRREEEAG